VLSDVKAYGVNVAVNEPSFSSEPNGAVIIPLALYNLTFKIQDTITTLPISGATVTVILPDGSTESNSTAADGTVTFPQLPISGYAYEVNGNWLLQSTGNTSISSDGSISLDVTVIYLPSLAAVASLTLVTIIALTVLVKRRKEGRQNALPDEEEITWWDDDTTTIRPQSVNQQERNRGVRSVRRFEKLE
jgi:hypothetical protein